MTVIIELTPEQEAYLIAAARQQGIDPNKLTQKFVIERLSPVNMDSSPPHPITPADKIRAMDAFAEKNRGLPIPPGESFDRENLYDERI